MGVIGGGQLARMMAPPATNLGITLRVLVESETGAAAQVIPHTRVGNAADLDACRWAGEGADVLTFEHEHIPSEVMAALEQTGPAVRPSAAALKHAQDKRIMRQAMAELGLPNPRWQIVRTPEDIATFAFAQDCPVVVKTARGGYDGKGVAFYTPDDNDWDDVEARLTDSARGRLREQFADWLANGEVIVEEKIDFAYELAVLVARRPSGHMRSWPVIQTIQENGVCAQTIAPAPISEEVARRARQIGEQVAAGLDVTGVLAVEMFCDHAGALTINELAMRPHNSGHWTIDGAITSQFENHLRAVLDLPLGETAARAPACVMVNLLHCQLADPRQALAPALAACPQAKIHLYGKDPRPERKIGHVTVCAETAAEATRMARQVIAILSGEKKE